MLSITYLNNYYDIYLLDSNNYLAKTKINLHNKETKKKIEEIINILTIDKQNNKQIIGNFKPIIPQNTIVKDIEIFNNEATINFNNNILNIKPNYEEKMIEAIVYSITSLKEINSVNIKVNGNILEEYPHSKKKISYPLDRSIKINKEYNVSKLNDIKEVTVFYNAIDENIKYYIPVTKYLDNTKDKIEIIIDELKSSSTYNSNLVNYLNQETKLASYQIINNNLILNLINESINLKDNNISEETYYALNESIKETYNVDNVICFFNNKLII